MKKYLIVLALAVFVFTFGVNDSEAAAKAQMNTGCGLGSTLIEGNDSLLAQLGITFLNGICGNQTFGITLGTSGCKKFTSVASTETQNFVAKNMEGLAKDIAMGSGESLDTLAELLAVPAAERVEFNSTLQASFSDIFTSESVEAGDVFDNIVTLIS
ncbi:MAG: DUF3015 family protein [Deltaproteobacteria bacterium]|nr:DUF3015 family protein [Deltaproteobacteria bacterium]